MSKLFHCGKRRGKSTYMGTFEKYPGLTLFVTEQLLNQVLQPDDTLYDPYFWLGYWEQKQIDKKQTNDLWLENEYGYEIDVFQQPFQLDRENTLVPLS